ncbi:hypothetical protein BH24BAC1_BH24BAC1_40780 [soil metagenome]
MKRQNFYPAKALGSLPLGQRPARMTLLALALLLMGCSENLLHRRYYGYNNPWLERQVSQAATEGKTGQYPLFVLEGRPLQGEQIADNLTGIRQEEIAGVEVRGKKEAKAKYGSLGRQGAVELSPVPDAAFRSEYYDYNNPLLTQLVSQFLKRGMVQSYPLYVLDGQPLGGEEIRNRLSASSDEEIAAVEVLKQTTANELYGIQARNGVVLISTKENRKQANN